jgi:hypothetical protein
MPIMQVIRVSIVQNGDVAACGAVRVRLGMLPVGCAAGANECGSGGQDEGDMRIPFQFHGRDNTPTLSARRKKGSCKSLAAMSLAVAAPDCFTAIVLMMTLPQRRHVKRNLFAVALMLGLYLALQVLAHSDFLHHCAHEDSHAPEHQCVIKLVADGQLLIGPLPQFDFRPLSHDVPLTPPPSSAVLGDARLLPPGRAPPATPA